MSIQNVVSNTISKVTHGAGSFLTEVSAKVQNMLGGATAQLSSLWDGGFVGIDISNSEQLTQAIEAYISELNEIVNKFDTSAKIDGALKGEAATAAIEYVTAVKTLLSAYTSTYRNFCSLLTETVENMQTGDTENASAIRSDAQDITTQANDIRVD